MRPAGLFAFTFRSQLCLTTTALIASYLFLLSFQVTAELSAQLSQDLSSPYNRECHRLPEIWQSAENQAIWPDPVISRLTSSPFNTELAPSHLLDFIGSDHLQDLHFENLVNPAAIQVFSNLLALSHSVTEKHVKSDVVRHRNASQSHVQLRGLDTDIRPVAVTFQKAFEASLLQKLYNKQLKHCRIFIHTPRPATPLCNQSGQVLDSSIHSTMQADEKRLKTVRDRTLTLRQLARFGPEVELFVVYPKSGIERRTQAEQAIYQSELSDKRNISLYDHPLECESIPPSLCGASYFLKLESGETLFFSLNGSQAADCDDAMLWEYWFDNINHPDVKARHDKVVSFLEKHGLKVQGR
ncbi:hypothetical protein [Spongorhabdus nitratireducens]